MLYLFCKLRLLIKHYFYFRSKPRFGVDLEAWVHPLSMTYLDSPFSFD
uniref:Uncharacterized protein n=1 Tax=Anguilla anguilla TaxID=7936 RepID=A0A0E9SWH4_ANGAN